jgi:hypothetical protein
MTEHARHSAESAARLGQGPAMDFLESIVPTPGADVAQEDWDGVDRPTGRERERRIDEQFRRILRTLDL